MIPGLHKLKEAVSRELNEPLPMHGEVGNSRHYNIMSTPTQNQGTSSDYTLRRLRRDNPDLAERVLSGELSAHAAAQEAGFRKRRVAVNLDDLASAARTLCNKLSEQEVHELIDRLYQRLSEQ